MEHLHTNGVSDSQRAQAQACITSFFTHVKNGLRAEGMTFDDSPLWRPWHITVLWDARSLWCAFRLAVGGGIPEVLYFDKSSAIIDEPKLRSAVADGLDWHRVDLVVRLPRPGAPNADAKIRAAAAAHVAEVEKATKLSRITSLSGPKTLDPQYEQFLKDHPDLDRNVFLIMPFHPSEHLIEAYPTIVKALAAHGLKGLRADERVYVDDLWANIQIYLNCCAYGIAVFEQIDKKDFNPNVALEHGYMLGLQKRVLLLKEKRLDAMPADLMGKLYKPWDAFHVETSMTAAIDQWVSQDLKLSFPPL